MHEYASEADELRAATREAHEMMGDLARQMKEAEKLVAQIQTEADKAVAERVSEAVATGLEKYSKQILAATEASTAAVFERFDTIFKVITGMNRKGDLIASMLAAQEAGVVDQGLDIAGLKTPLSSEVTGL